MAETKSCPFCAEEINAAAVKCKHCGSMLTGSAPSPPSASQALSQTPSAPRKSRTLYWVLGIGGGLAVLGAIGRSGEDPTSSHQESAARPSAANQRRASSDPPAAQQLDIPSSEAAFIQAVSARIAAYGEASNEIKKSSLRRERGQAIAAALRRTRDITGWVGTIKQIRTNSDGDASIEVDIGHDIVLKTWNNALSDSGSHTLIKQANPLYAVLGDMKQGDPIVLSGAFVKDDQDFVREASMSERGSMTEPEFILRFSDIRKK